MSENVGSLHLQHNGAVAEAFGAVPVSLVNKHLGLCRYVSGTGVLLPGQIRIGAPVTLCYAQYLFDSPSQLQRRPGLSHKYRFCHASQFGTCIRSSVQIPGTCCGLSCGYFWCMGDSFDADGGLFALSWPVI